MASFFPSFCNTTAPPSLSPPPPLPPTPVELDRARDEGGTPELPRRHRRASRRVFFGFGRISSAVILPPPATNSATSDLITRRRAVTTTQGSQPPTQLTAAATAAASAATTPALMAHSAVGPAGSQAPASSASSVAQPVSARRRHRPASITDATSTDASGSQPVSFMISKHLLPLKVII
ncbi:hypothetical protein L3X38_006174 [Prunus dulcis]|uniref:Uncharacterized protein n=1 Tax=Prunus dulcis TaxID=3755 RepID=A0AAD5F4S4_PRUDU|nr:hypothetical protein L3X38_006174 [Prunus dulcis]